MSLFDVNSTRLELHVKELGMHLLVEYTDPNDKENIGALLCMELASKFAERAKELFKLRNSSSS